MKLAAGILPYCSQTQRFLLAKRGPMISNPNQWTNFGGKAEQGESSKQTAIREFREESGYKGSVKIVSKGYPTKNKKDGFVFVSYIGEVPNEFKPSTIGKKTVDGDVEVSAAKWVTFEQLMKLKGSSILHPGFNEFLLGNEMSLKTILEQFDQQLEEENVTGSGESYYTPFTFTKKEKRPKDASYSKVPPTTERFFKKINSVINEISYKDFKNDSTFNERQKINNHILEINRKLKEVEQMISHAHKLKNESGQTNDVFWKRTQGSFLKIKERLNRLTSKIVEITG